jgi:AcrR family transcriptional regulator
MVRSTAVARTYRPAPEAKSARGRNRRERILAEAARLFHHQGFHQTGIDEIGAAVGITGPGVYRHFESKQHLLAAIVDRSLERHKEIVGEVSGLGLDACDALRRLVELSASELARNRDAAAMYFQEARNLGPAELARFTKAQRLLITQWVDILRQARPELSEEQARVAVRAVGGLLNSVAYFATTMTPELVGKMLADMALAALLEANPARA